MTDSNVKEGINKVITELMDRVMDRVLSTDPFIKEEHHSKKPLYAALVPDEIFKGSHFERRFVTPFGGVWERLAEVVAGEYHGHCETGAHVNGEIGAERLRRIQEVLNGLEHKGKDRSLPNWKGELQYILEGGGKLIPISVVCDVVIDSIKTKKLMLLRLKHLFLIVIKPKLVRRKCLSYWPCNLQKWISPFLPFLIILMAKKQIIIGRFPKDGLI